MDENLLKSQLELFWIFLKVKKLFLLFYGYSLLLFAKKKFYQWISIGTLVQVSFVSRSEWVGVVTSSFILVSAMSSKFLFYVFTIWNFSVKAEVKRVIWNFKRIVDKAKNSLPFKEEILSWKIVIRKFWYFIILENLFCWEDRVSWFFFFFNVILWLFLKLVLFYFLLATKILVSVSPHSSFRSQKFVAMFWLHFIFRMSTYVKQFLG